MCLWFWLSGRSMHLGHWYIYKMLLFYETDIYCYFYWRRNLNECQNLGEMEWVISMDSETWTHALFNFNGRWIMEEMHYIFQWMLKRGGNGLNRKVFHVAKGSDLPSYVVHVDLMERKTWGLIKKQEFSNLPCWVRAVFEYQTKKSWLYQNTIRYQKHWNHSKQWTFVEWNTWVGCV